MIGLSYNDRDKNMTGENDPVIEDATGYTSTGRRVDTINRYLPWDAPGKTEITRAVNAHDALMSAAYKALTLIWDADKKVAKVSGVKAHDGATVEQVAWTIQAALAKAQGR